MLLSGKGDRDVNAGCTWAKSLCEVELQIVKGLEQLVMSCTVVKKGTQDNHKEMLEEKALKRKLDEKAHI